MLVDIIIRLLHGLIIQDPKAKRMPKAFTYIFIGHLAQTSPDCGSATMINLNASCVQRNVSLQEPTRCAHCGSRSDTADDGTLATIGGWEGPACAVCRAAAAQSPAQASAEVPPTPPPAPGTTACLDGGSLLQLGPRKGAKPTAKGRTTAMHLIKRGTILMGEHGQAVRVTSVIFSRVRTNMVRVDDSLCVSAEHPVRLIGEPRFAAAAQLLRRSSNVHAHCEETSHEGPPTKILHCNPKCRSKVTPYRVDAGWYVSDSAWNFTTEHNQAVRAAGSKFLIAPIGHPGWSYEDIPPSSLHINPSRETWQEVQSMLREPAFSEQWQMWVTQQPGFPAAGERHQLDGQLPTLRPIDSLSQRCTQDPGPADDTAKPSVWKSVANAATRLLAEQTEFTRALGADSDADPDYAAIRKAVNGFLSTTQAANDLVAICRAAKPEGSPLQFASEHIRSVTTHEHIGYDMQVELSHRGGPEHSLPRPDELGGQHEALAPLAQHRPAASGHGHYMRYG